MKEYRVGIIGFGFMGKVHAYGHINLPLFYDPAPLRSRITHICDTHAPTAQKGAGMFGARAVTDYRQVTENPEVDIVHICTPNLLHKDPLLSAMKHNKHVLVDKPLTATMDEARQIEAALKDYQATGQMELQSRFFPATMRARQLIEQGFLGKVLQFRTLYLHAGSADPKAPLKWKLSAAAGGGVVPDLGSHILDLMHFLLGDYDKLFATTHIAYPERPSADEPSKMVKVEAEDVVTVVAKMTCGALGTLEATKLATGSEDEIRFEIHGANGGLRFNCMDPHHLEAYDASITDQPLGGNRGWTRIDCGQRYGAPKAGTSALGTPPKPATMFPGPKFAIGWIRSHLACIAGFLQNVADGKPGDPPLSQGVYIQHLMECVKQSARTEKWVTV